MDVGPDDALRGFPAGLGLGPGVAFFPQDLDGFIDISVGLGERALALHHADPRALPEIFNHLCRDVHD